MRRQYYLYFVLLLILTLIGTNKATAKLEIIDKPVRAGDKICLNASIIGDVQNIYLWNSEDDSIKIADWPGLPMSAEGSNYCFSSTSDTQYNRVIFNNSSGVQTIDLNTIGDNQNLITKYLFKFDSSNLIGEGYDYGKYDGDWYVYDTSALVNLVEQADAIDRDQYTILSYNNVNAVLGDNSYTGNCANDVRYLSGLKFNTDTHDYLKISSNEGVYSSCYLTGYNLLKQTIDNLVKRKTLLLADSPSGAFAVSYKENSDTEIEIQVDPSIGYELSALTVSKVISYNENDMELGEVTNLNISPDVNSYTYSFASSEYQTNDMVGLYIEPTFSKKQYTITFNVGENGSFQDLFGNTLIDPVQVEYNDDYSMEIIGNEGYEIDKVTINGEEYNPINNTVTIEHVQENKEVKVTFSLKSYKITVNGVNYELSYGTSYEELVSVVAPDKEGYEFVKLIDENGNTINEGYTVDADVVLTAVYKEISKSSSGKDFEETEIASDTNEVSVENTRSMVSYYMEFLGIMIILVGAGILIHMYWRTYYLKQN